jgi:hypothetical protein
MPFRLLHRGYRRPPWTCLLIGSANWVGLHRLFRTEQALDQSRPQETNARPQAEMVDGSERR